MNIRLIKDKLAGSTMLILTLASVLLAILVGWGLYYKSLPLLEENSVWDLLSSSVWKPSKGEFGFFAFIMGTLWVTGIAIVIALPLCLLCAIFISEYAHPRLRKIVVPVVDLLSGIPPVVFGVWGVLFVVPLIEDYIAPVFVDYPMGYSVLAGGIVLGVMIFPLIISLLLEVFSAVPKEMRDASLSMGATQWQTVKFVLLRKSKPGIIVSVVLAVSRAFGETIAVLMVCGSVIMVPGSVFDPGYPLPALIANNYGEMLSAPEYESALLFAAFLLFVIIFLFNAISRIVLGRIKRKIE
ncbi:MAG: phosphate ABC transporter permease subunit PstC [Bacteroidetes bacterium]|nr:phosphate ABC transporter permease subunit PstC [Bacteroidota bacterium]